MGSSRVPKPVEGMFVFGLPSFMTASCGSSLMDKFVFACRHDARLKLTGIPTLFKYEAGGFGDRVGGCCPLHKVPAHFGYLGGARRP